MLEIVELILYFNQLNQSGQGLKILKRNQMLSRLPITLTQSNAGNDSEKLKNEIRNQAAIVFFVQNKKNQPQESIII